MAIVCMFSVSLSFHQTDRKTTRPAVVVAVAAPLSDGTMSRLVTTLAAPGIALSRVGVFLVMPLIADWAVFQTAPQAPGIGARFFRVVALLVLFAILLMLTQKLGGAMKWLVVSISARNVSVCGEAASAPGNTRPSPGGEEALSVERGVVSRLRASKSSLPKTLATLRLDLLSCI